MPRASSSALQISAAAVPALNGIHTATAALSGSCATESSANGKTATGTTSGALQTPATVGPAAHQSTAQGQDKDSACGEGQSDADTPLRAAPVAAAAAAASQSAAAGPSKGSKYLLGSLEVWGKQWGAMQLACRKLAAVPHQHRVSACLALHAQEALWASDKVRLQCSLLIFCRYKLSARSRISSHGRTVSYMS